MKKSTTRDYDRDGLLHEEDFGSAFEVVGQHNSRKTAGDFDGEFEIVDEEEEELADEDEDDVAFDDSEFGDDEDALIDPEELEISVDATDDPVRMYLMQMGEISLLNRHQEIAHAKRIELMRAHYRQWLVSTDFVLLGATKLLEQVRDGKLRLDRTIEVSVTNAAEKTAIMRENRPKHRYTSQATCMQSKRLLHCH